MVNPETLLMLGTRDRTEDISNNPGKKKIYVKVKGYIVILEMDIS